MTQSKTQRTGSHCLCLHTRTGKLSTTVHLLLLFTCFRFCFCPFAAPLCAPFTRCLNWPAAFALFLNRPAQQLCMQQTVLNLMYCYSSVFQTTTKTRLTALTQGQRGWTVISAVHGFSTCDLHSNLVNTASTSQFHFCTRLLLSFISKRSCKNISVHVYCHASTCLNLFLNIYNEYQIY